MKKIIAMLLVPILALHFVTIEEFDTLEQRVAELEEQPPFTTWSRYRTSDYLAELHIEDDNRRIVIRLDYVDGVVTPLSITYAENNHVVERYDVSGVTFWEDLTLMETIDFLQRDAEGFATFDEYLANIRQLGLIED